MTTADEDRTEQAADAFAEEVERFRRDEHPEVVLVVADDPVLTKIVIAWNTIDVDRRTDLTPAHGASDRERWARLWECVEYSTEQLTERSGLTRALVERRLPQLIANRVLYPDGTVHSFVQRHLREQVLKLFQPRRKGPATRA